MIRRLLTMVLMVLGAVTPAMCAVTEEPKQSDGAIGGPASVNLTFGSGSTSSLSSLFYVNAPQGSGKQSLSSGSTAYTDNAKDDTMIVQNADIGFGIFRLKLDYQDIGADFASFDAFRASRAAASDVLAQLEKEKGLKRLGLASDVKIGQNSALSLAMGSVEDAKGEIASQSMSYSGSSLGFGFSRREVDKTFTRFAALRETDKAQIANEAGMTCSQYFLRLRTARAKDKSAGWSSFTNTILSGEGGDLTYRTASLDFGKVKFQADMRSAGSEFNSLKAISDDERTSMALAARQQFDPQAAASSVVAADKAQMVKEAGLDRESYRARYDAGSMWLSLARSNISSVDGGVNRTDYHVQHKAFKLHFGRQQIDAGFSRLASMQPTERKHFGNERGMGRTELDGEFKLGFGELSVARKRVTDQDGAAVKRDKLDFKNSRAEFHANIQTIDPNFSRIADLSDTDRALLSKDLGFRRSDYSLKLTPMRGVKAASYFYDAQNASAGQVKGQRKHEIQFDSPNGLRFTALLDDFSFLSDAGNVSSYSHRKFTFDNKFNVLGGLLFRGLSDTNTTYDEDGAPVTTQVSQAHIEASTGGGTTYILDTLQTDLGNGAFQNTWGFGFRTPTAGRLALLGSYSRMDTNAVPEVNATAGLEWSLGKNLKLKSTLNNRDGGPKGSQQSHQFSFTGAYSNKRLGLEGVKIGSAMNSTQLRGRQTVCDNGLKIEGGFLGGAFLIDNGDKLNPTKGIYYTSRIVSFASDKDSKKRYHFTYYRQNLITLANQQAKKRKHTLDMKVTPRLTATASSYEGKDGVNGAVLPVQGGLFRLNLALAGKSSLYADYAADANESTLRRARTAGLGFKRTGVNGSALELYCGISRLAKSKSSETDTVFRIRYDHKINASHYLSLSAQQRSAVETSSAKSVEGDVTADLQFKMAFH